MRITFNVRGFLDRRSGSLDLQKHADALLEKQWRQRVARNIKERARLDREERRNRPAMLLRQAD
jgi:hypothetical protein